MPFPISLSGALTVRDVSVEQAIERLEVALADAKAVALRRAYEFANESRPAAGFGDVTRPA